MSARRNAAAAGLVLSFAVVAACSSSENPGSAPAGDPDASVDTPDVRVTKDAGAVVDANTPVTGPERLSEAGLYSDIATKTLAPGLIPFAPRYSFWSDGAEKNRWLSLPPGTQIDTSNMDGWVFPIGTKVFKEFHVGGKLVETRLLMKVRDDAPDGWWMGAYVWNEAGTEATLAPTGLANAFGTGHLVPSQTDCRNCHQGVRDVLIGVSAIQLSHTGRGYTTMMALDGGSDAASDAAPADASPPADAGTQTSVLQSLAAAGLLTNPPASDFDVPGTGTVQDALAYLHANCGSCHNDESPAVNQQTKIRLRLSVAETAPESTGAYTTTIGTVMKHPIDGATDVVVRGQPSQSGLVIRMGHRDNFAMPPIGSVVSDPQGIELIGRWISGL